MKIAEITGGAAVTLCVRGIEDALQSPPHDEDEVTFTSSAERILLAWGERVWPVDGVGSQDRAALRALTGNGLPTVAFVAQSTPDHLVIETRQFGNELRIAEPMLVGIDEKVLADLRRGHRVDGTLADVAAWMEDRLFMPAAPGAAVALRRGVISGDARGNLDAFRLYGHRIAVDLRRAGGKLLVERVVRGGRGANQRQTLLSAPLAIVDASVAPVLQGSVRTTLSAAVAQAGSYLRSWQEYHHLEKANVLRRARALGAIAYESREQRPAGGWRFQVAAGEDVAARVSALGEWERFELEACDEPPRLDEDVAPARGGPRPPPRLSAAIARIDERRGVVELHEPDDDEASPTPPEKGFLCLSLLGDKARLRRRERAEETLRLGANPLPQLGLLMEGRPVPAERRVRCAPMSSAVREAFGRARATQRQLEAIDRALNTPDICLIQGPPGTGKTQVITAIERRLAELADEGVEPSHRILITAAQHDAVENVMQRTTVFGLPAFKVGRRRHEADARVDPAAMFADEQAAKLQAKLRVRPEAERLARARDLAVACAGARALPGEQAHRVRELVRVLHDLLTPELRDQALACAVNLERPAPSGEREVDALRLQAARGIRADAVTFSDDGPFQARRALRRLDDILTSAERAFLERCAVAEPGDLVDDLDAGVGHRASLIDRLTRAAAAPELVFHDDTWCVVRDILDAVDRRLAKARYGEDAVIAEFLHDLQNDPDGVSDAIRHYTVVLAATLQQAAGNQMRRVRGVDSGQVTFESVIVDEAARAHPLDLFIPLSLARRRVVLVGDHRQLPHLLEPDVERELAGAVAGGGVQQQTLDAVRSSLFARLWVTLRGLEERDGIRRTVTLNAQYRMHPVLGEFVSRTFYESRGDGAIESPRPAEEFAHDLPGYQSSSGPCAAAWLDVAAGRGRELRGASKRRPVEAQVIAQEVRRLIERDSTLTFGVIAFYAAQVDEIRQAMLAYGLTEQVRGDRECAVSADWKTTRDAGGRVVERLRVGTVDSFQGKEFDVVFLSITRSNDLPGATDKDQRTKYGHLMLENRLCVAMSRQQRLLVAVGDLGFVRSAPPLEALRAFAELCGGPHGVVR